VNPATHSGEPAQIETEVSTMSLVYDVGMFNGDDTDYYLKKGFRVVGIEANPHLIPQLTERFSADIEQKCLVIENVAVAEIEGGGRVVHRWRR